MIFYSDTGAKQCDTKNNYLLCRMIYHLLFFSLPVIIKARQCSIYENVQYFGRSKTVVSNLNHS